MNTESVATLPVSRAAQYVVFTDKVGAFLQSARVVAADGLTWGEFGELFVSLVRLSVQALDVVAGMTGEQKKAAVLAAVGSLFDAVADKAIPSTLYPLWVLARPAVRSLVLALASGAVEQILPLVRGK